MKTLLIFCALLGFKTATASDLDFTLVNRTPHSFEAVYVSSTGNKDWDGNLLADKKPLAAGGKLVVKFSSKEKAPAWDLNVVDSDGLAVRFDKVDLENIDTVTLKVVDGKVTAVVE